MPQEEQEVGRTTTMDGGSGRHESIDTRRACTRLNGLFCLSNATRCVLVSTRKKRLYWLSTGTGTNAHEFGNGAESHRRRGLAPSRLMAASPAPARRNPGPFCGALCRTEASEELCHISPSVSASWPEKLSAPHERDGAKNRVAMRFRRR